MFDFDAGKLLIIGVVALIVIGPKDLPRVLRQVGQTVAKLRRMASEFQSQFMEAMREAELDDIRKDMASLNDIGKLRSFNPLETVRRELTEAMSERTPARMDYLPPTPSDEGEPLLNAPAERPEASFDPLEQPLLPFTTPEDTVSQSSSVSEAPAFDPASARGFPAETHETNPIGTATARSQEEARLSEFAQAEASRSGGSRLQND